MGESDFDPNKKYFLSRSGKRGYIRVCQRCGEVLYNVGKTTKWCFDCKKEIYNEKTRERYKKIHGSESE